MEVLENVSVTRCIIQPQQFFSLDIAYAQGYHAPILSALRLIAAERTLLREGAIHQQVAPAFNRSDIAIRRATILEEKQSL
jgi:hypothetical protein